MTFILAAISASVYAHLCVAYAPPKIQYWDFLDTASNDGLLGHMTALPLQYRAQSRPAKSAGLEKSIRVATRAFRHAPHIIWLQEVLDFIGPSTHRKVEKIVNPDLVKPHPNAAPSSSYH